jgi:hypothetical protein
MVRGHYRRELWFAITWVLGIVFECRSLNGTKEFAAASVWIPGKENLSGTPSTTPLRPKSSIRNTEMEI